MNNIDIAIIAVGYNRKDSMERLLSSLNNAVYGNDNITLIISIDKSDTDTVETFAEQFCWNHGEKIVDKHTLNMGLRRHMMSLDKWFASYNALIILEDDIVVSPYFYSYAKTCILKYSNDPQIAGISLYNFDVNYQTRLPFTPMKNGHDVYFMNCAMSWGEVWMKKQWKAFKEWLNLHEEFSYSPTLPGCLFKWGKNSWLKYHTRYCIEENKYFVYPYNSYSTNFGDKGVHHAGYGFDIAQVPLEMGDCHLKLPCSIDDDCVKYDGFFENKSICNWLGINDNSIIIDLNGLKCLSDKSFILSSKILDYKIIRSFGMDYHPIEANILMNNSGYDLFLYSTDVKCKNIHRLSINRLYTYYYHITSIPDFLRKIGFMNIAIECIRYFFIKIKSKFS